MTVQQQKKNQPWDEIDFVLMIATAIVPPHWPWALLLASEAVTRRNPRVAAYVMDALDVDRVPTWLLPGAAALPDDRERKTIEMPRMSMPLLAGLLPVRERRPEPVSNPTGASFAPVAEPVASRAAAVDARAELPAALPGTLTLADIADADNVWVVGPKNSGKTTVLHALIARRVGGHVALDPHNTPGKWPCRVIGGGRRYDQISAALARQVKTMDERYKAMDAGDLTEAECKGAARQTIIGDEWTSVSKELPERKTRGEIDDPGAGARLITILSEGRKAGICVMAAAHADTGTAMGVLGKTDILKCFDYIIYLGAMATKRYPAAAAMARPAVVYDPERDIYAPLDTSGIVAPPPTAPPAAPAPDDLLASLLAMEPTPPDDGLSQEDRIRLDIARRLIARGIGRTRAIQTAWPGATGPKYQQWTRIV